jgi:c-di-GMP-binding flagellar brake protein YcgR
MPQANSSPTVNPDANLAPSIAAGIVAGTPAATAILSDDEYSKFLLRHKNEILPVLRGLITHVSQVTMFFNEGRDMVLTSIVRLDDDAMVLDLGPNSELNRKALEAAKLFCITQLDKVKIQFLLRGLSLTDDGGRQAFKTALPETVLRLQRREYFRLALPITRPLSMLVPMKQLDGTQKTLDLQVGDLSGGGLAIVNLPLTVQIEIGMEFQGCRLDLPEVGLITTGLRVCSLMDTRSRGGATLHRAGCEFFNLPGPQATLIQRYIIKIERERKARESGMS